MHPNFSIPAFQMVVHGRAEHTKVGKFKVTSAHEHIKKQAKERTRKLRRTGLPGFTQGEEILSGCQ
jgi:hypothetical protein